MPPLTPGDWSLLAFAVALVGVSKSGFGGGLGIFAIPLMTAVLPPRTALVALLPLLIVADLVALWQFRREFRRDLAWRCAPGVLAGILAGAWLLGRVSDAALKQGLGAICLAFCALQLVLAALKRHPPAHHWGGWPSASVFGAAAGFTSTLAHAAGPVVTMYLLPLRLSPAVYAGTFTVIFFGINLAKVPAYASGGLFSPAPLLLALCLAPAAVAGSLVGVWLNRRFDAARFQAWILALLFLTGLEYITGRSLLNAAWHFLVSRT